MWNWFHDGKTNENDHEASSSCSAEAPRRTTTTTTCFLMEVVSARDIRRRKRTLLDPGEHVDPCCVVRFSKSNQDGGVVHKTDAIYNDADPIWTVKTKSLCLIDIPDADKENEHDEDASSVIVEVCHGDSQCLGTVSLSFADIRASNGERNEYPICVTHDGVAADTDDDGKIQPMLALRFRKATQDDLIFFKKTCLRGRMPPNATEASDINLAKIQEKKMLQSYEKREGNNIVKYRVQPYPDPDSPETTTWMTQQEVYDEALKPSKKWVKVGSNGGDIGKVHVEIIACNDLPNMDLGVGDFTDPFVGLVFEDNMVRTDVIHDALDPRWMPWCTRAFCFNINHPSSILMLGVFDYDATTTHDPIGRVIVNMANFQSDTTYLLHYALHDDPKQEDDQGTIIIRLRVEWKNESDARKLAFKLPPRFLINVDNQKAFGVLRYICRGKVNMEQPSVESVKFYANELMTYGLVYCYLVDVAIGVLLWRGRANVRLGFATVNIWFPIHSVALFTAAVVAIERPDMIPAIFFFGVSYMMLVLNYHGSRYPYPWNRCKSWQETNKLLVLGRSVHPPIYIEPYTGVDEAMELEKLDRVKAERVSRFLWDAKTVGLKVKRIYAKTSVTGHAIDTKEDEQWFAGSLYYVHMALMYLCTYLRVWRNFVNWKGYYAHKMTLKCLILGFAWILLPMNTVLVWTFRILVWTCLGPWMKLVDIMYIHQYYRTTEELMSDPTVKDTNLEAVLTSKMVQTMGSKARLASEEALKLKDMREAQFGKLSQLVPPVDKSLRPYIPLPDSTAEPYDSNKHTLPKTSIKWERASGQKLEGIMLPMPKRSDVVTFQM